MAEVICIPVDEEEKRIVRVAAYCRVSSLPQEDSYESQVEHFTTFISTHPDWRLVKVYGDEGVTGLNTLKREGFKRMLADGKRRKFDLLLVKSISRLGRNTVDLLSSVRELRAAGVRVYFEKENLSTDESAGELMITLLSAFAQMESESISANVRIGLNYKMQRGEWSVAYSTFLGYDRTPEGEIIINIEQAETVRFIFEWFLRGRSLQWIARELIVRKRLTGTGTLAWNKASVQRILQNRKYCGDVILQLSITEDVLTKHRVPNNGQAPQYVVMNGIPAIVSRQEFFLAQGELERRGRMIYGECYGPDVTSYKNGFTGKLQCSCGANYNRVNAKGQYVWKCYNRIHGECKAPIVNEKELEAVVLVAAKELWHRKVGEKKEVPVLTEDSDREELLDAAVKHMENVFTERVRDFTAGKFPMEYSAGLLDLVERITLDGRFTVKFHTGITVSVERMKVHSDTERYAVHRVDSAQTVTPFHVTGEPRKRLVQRLAALTGDKVHYLGFPTFAYEVGELVVRKDGAVEGKLSKRILAGLARSGFVKGYDLRNQ